MTDLKSGAVHARARSTRTALVWHHVWLWLPLFVLAMAVLFRVGLAFPAWPIGNRWFGLFDMPLFFYFMPFFVLGYLLWHQRDRFDRLIQQAPWFIAPVAAFWLAFPFLGDQVRKSVPFELASFTVTVFEVFLALSLFRWLCATERPTIRKLADASYTMYLVHILVLTLYAKLLLYWGLDGAWVYVPLTLFTLATCYVIHTRLVAGRPMAEFLMNGKAPRRLKNAKARIYGSGHAVKPGTDRP